MKLKGIDISEHQGKIDFSKVKKAGIQFVIPREGRRFVPDDRFFEYVNGCTKVGIPVLGVYHFSYALNTDQARQEAQSCVRNVKKAGLSKNTVIFFDFEYDTVKKAKAQGVNLGRLQCIAHTKAFCEEVEKQGYRSGIYSNQDYYKHMYDPAIFRNRVFWLAHYTTGSPAYTCSVQQYISKGKVDGIKTNVDMDWWFDEVKVDTMTDRQKFVNQAKSWIGCNEGDGSFKKIIDVYNAHKPLAMGYRVQYTDEWCATFVSAVAIKTGLTKIIPTECGCERMINLFKKLGEWVESDSHVPSAGEILFYDWDDSGRGDNTGFSDHVAIVESCDGTNIHTIEGNMGSGYVGRRNLIVNSRYIRGYGVPKYTSTATAKPTTTKKSVEEIAREVVLGKWGNGDDRINRLKSAGYDPAEVQKKVNLILTSKKPEKKSVDVLAREVIAGMWGNGTDRINRLKKEGYDPEAVQKKVNELLKGR